MMKKALFRARRLSGGILEERHRQRKARSIFEKDLTQAIERLEKSSALDPSLPDDDPLFIFSAGWRSGSTFLQRLCMSSGDRLVWGEPYDASGIVQRMADQLRPFGAPSWPQPEFFLEGSPPHDELVDSFIANLYPELDALRAAHRAYFDGLLKGPAHGRGYQRWGMKEVRLGTEHAAYLRWLYPNARFLFLVRNPYDAWRSYRPWRSWFWSWPDDFVATPARFAARWSAAATDFVENADRYGLLVRYEDLADRHQAISDHIGHPIVPPEELDRVGGKKRGKDELRRDERWLLQKGTAPIAARLGYD